MIIKQMYFNDEEFYELFEKSKTPYGDYDMSTIASNLNNLMSDRVQQELDKYKVVASGSVHHSFITEGYYTGDKSMNGIFSGYYGKQIEIFIKQIGKDNQ